MKERHVLAACIKSREAYDRIANHVGRDDLSEQGWIIWDCLGSYYGSDASCGYADPEILADQVARKVSADKHKEMFRTLVTNLGASEVSGANVVSDLLEHKRELAGHELASAILAGDTPNGILTKYTDLLIATELEEEPEEDARRGLNVEDLVGVGFDPGNLVEIYPLSLNKRLDGGVKPGHHLILFARPEMGKTMLTIEMMAGFARQGLTTLYIGNEDPLDDINMRVVNRLSGMTKAEVLNNPKQADKLARQQGYENIILKAMSPGTPREIAKLLDKYNPHVLVLDQLRNLDMGQDNYVLKLEQAATQARQWAKRHSCVVVSVTQAGDSAEGKSILTLGDVDYSNTGIPAQADVMIGIGADKNRARMGEIVISLPKNKVSGKHEYFPCTVEPLLSKVLPIE